MVAFIYSPLVAALSVRIDSTPYPDDPPNADDFYKALGTYMVAWGRFEGHLLGCLLMIRSLPGAPAEQNGFPVSFKRRATYWREAWQNISALTSHAPSAETLIADIMAEADYRSSLVHGIWREFVPAAGLTIRRLQVKPKRGSVTVHSGDLPVSALHDAVKRVNLLNGRLSHATRIVSRLLPPPNSPKL